MAAYCVLILIIIHTLYRDLLFGNIYDTFSGEDNLSKAVFRETLCQYVKDGKLQNLRTVVVKDFIDHYAQLGDYKLLEQCIIQLNPKCIDMYQVAIL